MFILQILKLKIEFYFLKNYMKKQKQTVILYKMMKMQYTEYMNEAEFDQEFEVPAKTINDLIREIQESDEELLKRLGNTDL